MQNLEIQKCTEFTWMHKRIKHPKQSIKAITFLISKTNACLHFISLVVTVKI